MKKNLLTILFMLTFLISNAQDINCKLVKDTMYYVSFDLRSKTNYPVQMNGVAKQININKLNLNTQATFIKSFYSNFFYTPELFCGYKKMLLRCMGDSIGQLYIKKTEKSFSIMTGQIDKDSSPQTLKLKNGETLYLKIVQIVADFWVVDKNDKGISSNSNELNIEAIDEINQCFVPFKIYKFKE